MVGFEPTKNTGVKILCLTAWRHPNNQHKALTSWYWTVHIQLFRIWSLISNPIHACLYTCFFLLTNAQEEQGDNSHQPNYIALMYWCSINLSSCNATSESNRNLLWYETHVPIMLMTWIIYYSPHIFSLRRKDLSITLPMSSKQWEVLDHSKGQ